MQDLVLQGQLLKGNFNCYTIIIVLLYGKAETC